MIEFDNFVYLILIIFIVGLNFASMVKPSGITSCFWEGVYRGWDIIPSLGLSVRFAFWKPNMGSKGFAIFIFITLLVQGETKHGFAASRQENWEDKNNFESMHCHTHLFCQYSGQENLAFDILKIQSCQHLAFKTDSILHGQGHENTKLNPFIRLKWLGRYFKHSTCTFILQLNLVHIYNTICNLLYQSMLASVHS